MEERIIKLSKLTAKVKLNNSEMLTIVDKVNLDIYKGKSYAIVGKSGSGKTSLISIIGLLNSSYEGDYDYKGISIKKLSDEKLSHLRNKEIGFIFQNYSLVKHLKVWENVELPLLYSKKKLDKAKRKEKVQSILTRVGLEKKIYEYPSRLSGGEQQRVTIARALVTSPEILICDEPTGALDKNTGEAVMKMILDLVKKEKTTLLLVTHDQELASACDISIIMDGGKVINV